MNEIKATDAFVPTRGQAQGEAGTIPGTPEGRPGVWLVTPETAAALVDAAPGDRVHCFLGMIGADWDKPAVEAFVRRPDARVALVFPPNFTLRHQLVVLTDDRRAFDVGEIDEARMRAAVDAPAERT
jgi:hypothetical protein